LTVTKGFGIAAENGIMLVNLAPLRKSDVIIGKPLPWPVYDRSRTLLLRQGFVIESVGQIERLLQNGLFRPSSGATTGDYQSTRNTDNSESPPDDLKSVIGSGTPGVTIANSKFEVGMAIQMSATAFPDERRVVKLIGFLDKKSILVTHPLKDGIAAFIKAGTDFKCRAFQKKNAYSFGTTVQKCELKPFPYLHLSYPAEVTAVPVRKTSRICIEIPASIVLKNKTEPVPCLIRDLSLSGVLVQSSEQLGEKQDVLSIAFRLSVDEEPTLFELELLVRNNVTREDDKNKGVHLTGCELEKIDPDLRRLLELYIYRELAQES
jgi:c-di-GMP-binding flagellar brake protein YcgR